MPTPHPQPASRAAPKRLWQAALAEPLMLAAALSLALAILFFIWISDKVGDNRTNSIDLRLMLMLRRPGAPGTPIGPAWLTEAAHDLSALGGPAVVIAVVCAVLGFEAVRGAIGRRVMWTIPAATLGGITLSTLAKHAFDRPRPDAVLRLADVHTASFPSGHSMMSAVIYLTLGAIIAQLTPGKRSKVYVLSAAMLLVGLVGCSRVFLGAHYPTDVLGGWAAGLAWALVCWLAARWMHLRRRRLKEQINH